MVRKETDLSLFKAPLGFFYYTCIQFSIVLSVFFLQLPEMLHVLAGTGLFEGDG